MSIDVSALPKAQFFGMNGLFPNIIANEIAAEQRAVDSLNATGKAKFEADCARWLSDANLVRNADVHATLPAKPVSPASWVALTQDGVVNAQDGKWIAQSQTGPIYGVCPDLPPLTVTHPSNVTGLVATGTVSQPTQDQKLDSIAATCQEILAALKKAGVA